MIVFADRAKDHDSSHVNASGRPLPGAIASIIPALAGALPSIAPRKNIALDPQSK